MKHFKIYNALLLGAVCLLIISSCTTKKDGFAYRVFHNTTARYNGYFYAKEALKEGQELLQKNFKEDYDEILPVFVYGDEETAQTIYPQMERTIEKSSRVIERHKMEPAGRDKKKMKRPEMNKWIDDNYLLIGIAYFYKRNYFKAEEIFLFVSRKYKDKKMQALSNAWLARTYLEREKYTKAKNMLLKAAQIKGLEDEVLAEVYLVFADYHLRLGELKEAKEKLEYALRYIHKKKDRARPTFILAQINQRLNQSQEAIKLYETVLKLRPPYEMEFYARINQAMAYDRRGGNSEVIKEQLFKMLKDEKNLEYQDQIYYALAEIELEERNREKGIAYLEKSLEVNKGNKKQKVKSFLRLADLYLDDRIYTMAQAYYDSTFSNISEEHPRYKDVKNKAESLTDLVENLDIIYYEDSVQRICDMDEVDQVIKAQSIIDAMREELEAAEAEKERMLAELAAAEGEAGAGQFWPYNPQLKAIGYQHFKEYWGDRPLEDNWRRSNKLKQSFDEGEEAPLTTVDEQETESGNIEDQLPTIEELLAKLPCDEKRRAESNARLAEAYYNAGVVYKEKLEDLDNAIEQWEVLTNRFEDSDYHPTTYYQLYRTYLYREQEEGYQNPFCGTCNSQYWAQVILEKYPGSEWASLVENPEYQDIVELERARAEEAYEQLYQAYHNRQYQQVINEATRVINEEPNNHLLCKYRILKAFAVGNMDALVGMNENYKRELQDVISSCPDTEEATFAQDVLNKLNQEEQTEEIPKDEKETPNQDLFQANMSAKHYFALIYPVGEASVNEVKAKISDFNKKHFQTGGLKISSNLLDRNNQVILVKTFNRIEDAQDYFRTFTGNQDELSDFNKPGFTKVLISKDNYVTLFKTKELEAYIAFFQNQYTF